MSLISIAAYQILTLILFAKLDLSRSSNLERPISHFKFFIAYCSWTWDPEIEMPGPLDPTDLYGNERTRQTADINKRACFQTQDS